MKVYKVTSASNLLEVLEPEGEGLAVVGRCSSNSHPTLDLTSVTRSSHRPSEHRPSVCGGWGSLCLPRFARSVCKVLQTRSWGAGAGGCAC